MTSARHSWEECLAPRALLLGCALSFLACCALGRLVSRQSPYKDFVRFHPFINYLSLYYPTASQTLALGRSLAAPDQIAVVVGGNSILHGHGQGPDHLWTRQLQALLGPRYRVLNFALHGCDPAEFGAVAADVLERAGRKVIFITVQFPGTAAATLTTWWPWAASSAAAATGWRATPRSSRAPSVSTGPSACEWYEIIATWYE